MLRSNAQERGLPDGYFEDAETNLEGQCAQVEINVDHVAAAELIHVFCYFSGEMDNEPN